MAEFNSRLPEEVTSFIRNNQLPAKYEHIRVTLMYANNNYDYNDYFTRWMKWTDDQRKESEEILREINNEVFWQIAVAKQSPERQAILLKRGR